MNADEIRAAIDAKLAEMGIEFVAVYMGESVEKAKPQKAERGEVTFDSKDWKYDLWRVSFQTAEGHGPVRVLMTEDFRTGLGHRKAPLHKLNPHPARTMSWVAWNEAFIKPQKPFAADVLYCFCSDGQAAHESFHDWASDFGFDTDSISALNTYNECGRIGRELRKVFGKELEAVSEIVREL